MDHRVATNRKLAERYLLGELSTPERDEFEDHFFSCEMCADDVRLTAAFVANAAPVLRDMPPAARKVRDSDGSRRWLGWLWNPIPAYAMTAVLAFFALQQRFAPTAALNAELVAPVSLRPVTRGEPQVIRVPEGQPAFHVNADARAGHAYTCEFRNAAGDTVVRVEAPAQQTSALMFLLPARKFEEGRYTLLIRSREGSSGQPDFQQDYEFIIDK